MLTRSIVQAHLSDPAIILIIKYLAKLGARESDIISFFADCDISRQKVLSLIETLVEDGELVKEESTIFRKARFHPTQQLPEIPDFIAQIIAAHITKKYKLEL